MKKSTKAPRKRAVQGAAAPEPKPEQHPSSTIDEIERWMVGAVIPYVSKDDRPWPCTVSISRVSRDGVGPTEVEVCWRGLHAPGREVDIDVMMEPIVEMVRSPLASRQTCEAIMLTLYEHGNTSRWGARVIMARAFPYVSPIEVAALDAVNDGRPDYPGALKKMWAMLIASSEAVETEVDALRREVEEGDPTKVRAAAKAIEEKLMQLDGQLRGWRGTTEAMADPVLYADLRR